MSSTRRKFDREFKIETVRLITQGNRKVSDVARGHMKPEDEEVRKLKKELQDVKEERDILKKALAIFSQRPK
jgi:transposase